MSKCVKTFGEKLQLLRAGLRLSQEGFGREFGVCGRQIRRLEKGVCRPSNDLVKRLAERLHISVGIFEEGFGMSKEEALSFVKPYILKHLMGVAQKLTDLLNELAELEAGRCGKIDRIAIIRQQLKGQAKYFEKVLIDLEKAEKL